MKRFLFLILAVLSPLALWAQVPNQLVTISSDGKHLVNSVTGQPVFLTGDSPQLLSIMLSNADVNTYLQDRAARGFNAIWVISTDQLDQTNPPKDFFGNVPFDGAWFTSPDPAYWAHQDSVIQAAQSLGITVFLMPSFVGNNDGNVYDTPAYRASTVATIQGYGTFIGNRYKGFNNIVYVLGGDYNPTDATIKPKLEALAAAIAAADPNHLITIEGCQNCGAPLSTTPYTSSTIPPWLGTNWTDTIQANAVASCQAAFSSSPFLPPFEGEDWYELEHGITGFQARQEGYWEVLSGCYVGRLFGNGPIWSFNAPHAGDTSPSWQSQLSSPGSLGEQFMGQLMRSREHWLMVPDTNHTVLTAGFGSGSTLSVAARSSDGQTLIAYFSDGNATAKTISMSSIVSSSSTAVAWWYAPLTGAATLIGTFPNSGSQSFTAPDGNDWVLVIDDAAANLGAPGGGTGSNPVPSITSLNPSSATAGGPTFTLTVNGSGFISSSVVDFNGSSRTTTFVSATQIKASILASDIATSGTGNVTVTNPSPGGGTTPNLAFTISSASNPVPTLASISPTSGPLGQSVALTLTGTNFIASSIINFGSNQNTGGVVSNGGDTLTITIPAAQLATAGPVSVTLTNPTPGGGTTGAQTFTVTNNNPAPTITTISPTSATVNGAGFTLTVNGSNFVNGSVVNFNGAAKSTTFVSATKVTASILAADLLTVGNFPVTVTNPAPGGGTSASVTFAVTSLSQSLTSISPSSATAGGAAFTLTLTGTGFVSGATVNFGTATITPSSVTSSQIVATIPAADIATAGTVNVTVTNPAGGGTSNAQTFTINNPAPTATSLSPTSASAGGAAFTLTVNGTGFVSTSVVKFNAAAKTTTFVSATQLTAAITAADIATAGTAAVTVTNPAPGGGTSGNLSFPINAASAPTLTSVAPASATAGGAAFTLTLTGTGFVAGATVNFGASPAITPSSVTSTQIVATIPAADNATAGTVNVTVTNPAGGGTSNAQTFSINNPAPTATSLSPTSASAGGAAFNLTVNGTGFVSTSVVKFNGAAKTTTFVSATQLTAAIAAADIATAGTATVTVTNPAPGGGTSGNLSFPINTASAPTLTSLAPASATAGGAAFTLTLAGTGFVAGATVNFGASPAITPSSVTSTQIVATIPAADITAAGTVNVAVTNPAGGGTSNAQTFTVNNPAPTEISIAPPSANAGGAAFTFTVTGTGFVSGAVVKFNGTTKTTAFVSATQVTAAIAAADIATAGTVNVAVTNPAPGGGTSGNIQFTINNPNVTVTSLSPASATAGGTGFTLTINGSGFASGATVNFGGNPPITPSSVTSTQIVATIPAADIAAGGTANVTVTNPPPGGGISSAQTFTINNPAPTTSSLSPTSATAGGAGFPLTVNGTGFVSGSIVKFNGVAKATSFVGSTQITAAITAADIATAGPVSVTVTNPAPSGGTSNAQTFTINSTSNLTITSLSPASATAGSAGFTLTVNGTGFVSGATVQFNGANRTTTFVSGTQVTAAILAADIATAGTASLTVTNPAPSGGTSNAKTFTINSTSNLTITSLSPASATAGSAGFTLTVNGTGFVSGATVQFNGANRTTTFVSSTQVTAAILAADIATAGTASVTVTNPAPSGGTSNAQTFTINSTSNLTITSLSPPSTTAGGAAFTLTVNGTGFVSGAVVKFGGVAKTTTFTSAAQLTATIAASDIASSGVQSITVTNPAPGGGTSNAATFTVNNAVPTLSSLSPSSVFAGSGAFTLTVNGTGFVNGASVQFNGASRTTTFVSSTQLTAAILASDIAAAGTANVTVINPAPTTGASASLALNITNENNPVPAISALDTTHVTGGAAFTLTVNGSNFEQKSVVNLNGKAEATTFVSTTRISAAIPASDVAVAGSVNVTVANPPPGGGTSSARSFFVDGYTVGGSSIASVASGQPAMLQITVTPTAGGFSNPVTFSISGLPSGVSALFNPVSVTPGVQPGSTMLTISDGGAAASRAKSQAGISGGGIAPTLVLIGVIVLLAWLGFETRDRSIPEMRHYATVGLFVFMLFAGSVLGGCALGVTSSPSSQTSQVTVTATSGTMAQTFGITLTVTR